jgi:hypothetical protein
MATEETGSVSNTVAPHLDRLCRVGRLSGPVDGSIDEKAQHVRETIASGNSLRGGKLPAERTALRRIDTLGCRGSGRREEARLKWPHPNLYRQSPALRWPALSAATDEPNMTVFAAL